MSKSMKLIAVATLGLGVFQNFGAEAFKVVSVECPKGLCVVKGSDDNSYTLTDDSKAAVYKALEGKEFKDSKGSVKINGKNVALSFEKQKGEEKKADEKKADPKPAQPK